MTRRVSYKGYIIDARARELPNGLGWACDFSIEEHDAQGVTDTPFFHREPPTHPNAEGALEVAIALGKKKIDDGFTPIIVNA